MSEERDVRGPAETDGEREKMSDVEAHKMSRLSEPDEEKRDKISETDDADVEGHMLGDKHSSGKMSS
jgi:hypothetical protein